MATRRGQASLDSSFEGGASLEFNDVHFSYPERPTVAVLRGFKLSVGKGKTLALCGGSGGGKSTIISLLERFYEPTSGSITMDGIDISCLPLQELRNQLGLVSQEPVLFEGSIYSNIAYGRYKNFDIRLPPNCGCPCQRPTFITLRSPSPLAVIQSSLLFYPNRRTAVADVPRGTSRGSN